MAAAPTNPAEAFGAGDPRNAQYFQTLASLEHQYNTTLAGDQQKLGASRENAAYQQGQLGEKEPLSYKANQHRSNAGGIAESGVNAERRGTIGTEYANKRFAVTHGLQETEGSISQNDQQALENRELGRGTAANTALSEGYKSLLEQQPNEAAASTSGVVPKVTTTPGGSVTVGGRPGPSTPTISREVAQRSTPGIRRTAAQTVLARARPKGRVTNG